MQLINISIIFTFKIQLCMNIHISLHDKCFNKVLLFCWYLINIIILVSYFFFIVICVFILLFNSFEFTTLKNIAANY